MLSFRYFYLFILVIISTGCSTLDEHSVGIKGRDEHLAESAQQVKFAKESSSELQSDQDSKDDSIKEVSAQVEKTETEEPAIISIPDPTTPLSSPATETKKEENLTTVSLDEVIYSVRRSFPLIQSARLGQNIANGNQLAAWGNFDTKLKGNTENGPTGFYRNYRNGLGLNQPLYKGGEVFGGYRIGRGSFEPWYLERQTNDGGEFKAGVQFPLLRNRDIDERRAELWRATFEQQRIAPEIQAQLNYFIRDASEVYWTWVAASAKKQIGEQALQLSLERAKGLEKRVEAGDLKTPVLKDNQRSIAIRRAKLLDLERKLEQSAIKLSLFYRDNLGKPLLVKDNQSPEFPIPMGIEESKLPQDIALALEQRPELEVLNAEYRKANVDLQEARNDFLPNLDAQLITSQDVGEPTSSKRDKSEFELEAALFVDVPLQRRKAKGKTIAAEAKMSQINIKRRFVQEKITAEVRAVYAALLAAYERVQETQESVELAQYMVRFEQRRFELGETNLLPVFLREQAAILAADANVDALVDYYIAEANYTAALALNAPVSPAGN